MSALKWHREAKACAGSLGIDAIRIVFRGRHPQLIGRYRGRPVTISISNSPSGMALMNVRADLRRRVRAIAIQDTT